MLQVLGLVLKVCAFACSLVVQGSAGKLFISFQFCKDGLVRNLLLAM